MTEEQKVLLDWFADHTGEGFFAGLIAMGMVTLEAARMVGFDAEGGTTEFSAFMDKCRDEFTATAKRLVESVAKGADNE